jgi:hypothetical protein
MVAATKIVFVPRGMPESTRKPAGSTILVAAFLDGQGECGPVDPVGRRAGVRIPDGLGVHLGCRRPNYGRGPVSASHGERSLS